MPVLLLTAVINAAPSSRISGSTYEERSAAFIRYLAAASPRNANFPKEAMPYYAARTQLGIDPVGTRAAIDRMLDATVKARPDPFNMHAIMHAYYLNRTVFTLAMREKIKRINPHFPALRSDSMALSGASRRKQITSSKKILAKRLGELKSQKLMPP